MKHVERSRLDILMVCDAYAPDVGGGELYNARVVESLRAAGKRLRVVTLSGGYSSEEIMRIPSVSVLGVKIADPFSLFKALLSPRPNRILLVGPSVNMISMALLACALRIPFDSFYYGELDWSSLLGRLVRFALFRFVLWKSERIFTYAQILRKILIERGISADRIIKVSIGADVLPVNEPALQRKNTAVFLGGIGRNHAYKRPDLFLRALALIRDRSLSAIVIGGGDSTFLASLATSLGIADRVTFRGFISSGEREEIIKHAKLLVLPSPSSREGFGIVVLESMLLGTPVIVGLQAGVAELVARSRFGETWEGEDPSTLACAIKKVLSYDESDFLDGFARFLRIASDYRWENLSAELASAFADR